MISFALLKLMPSFSGLLYLVSACFLSSCAHLIVSKQIANGVHYETVLSHDDAIAHIATIDLDLVSLDLVSALSPQTVSETAKLNHALVAINGGFFSKEGKAVGALKIDGQWLSHPTKNRGVFGFNNKKEVFFDRLQRSSKDEQIQSELSSRPWWNEADNIIGGAPLLIFDGNILDVSSEGTLQSFLTNKYARTSVCLDNAHKLKLIVIDGGDSTSQRFFQKGGMTIHELASFLLNLGCKYALNLDGGYSSSLVLEGHRKNRFSMPLLPERAVANFLVVTAKK